MILLGEALGPFLHGGLDSQHVFHGGWQVAHLGQQLGFTLGRQVGAHLGQHDGEQEQSRQLSGEGLGGGHTDLGAGTRQEAQLAVADEGRFRHVADRQRVGHAVALGMLQRSQRVGRLARLRDGDDERLVLRDRVAVAVFAGDLHVGGDARDGFQPVLGHHAGVIAGAAGQNQDAAGALEDLFGLGAEQAWLQRAGVLDHLQRVADGARLLEDLLLHVVVVVAQLDRIGRQLALDHRARHHVAGGVADGVAVAGERGQITFFQVDDVLGDLQQGRGVGGEEVLALARTFATHAQQQGRAAAGAHDGARLAAADDGQRIGAVQLLDGLGHGIGQRQAAQHQRMHQVRHHFGVGLRGELIALGLERAAQLFVVLDDAVVHHRDLQVGARGDVRVGIALIDAAVRRPAGVGDAGGGVGVLFLGAGVQLGHAAHGTDTVHVAFRVEQGQTGGVITAIFEFAQALDQDGDDIALCYGTNDSTHGFDSLVAVGLARRTAARFIWSCVAGVSSRAGWSAARGSASASRRAPRG